MKLGPAEYYRILKKQIISVPGKERSLKLIYWNIEESTKKHLFELWSLNEVDLQYESSYIIRLVLYIYTK